VASPSLGVAVQQQLEQDGSAAKVVTCAFNGNLLPLLQNGKVAFTIDQQPYLQGYLSIDSLWLYKKNKSVIGAQQSIPTGPVVVDHSKLGDILNDVKSGLLTDTAPHRRWPTSVGGRRWQLTRSMEQGQGDVKYRQSGSAIRPIRPAGERDRSRTFAATTA